MPVSASCVHWRAKDEESTVGCGEDEDEEGEEEEIEEMEEIEGNDRVEEGACSNSSMVVTSTPDVEMMGLESSDSKGGEDALVQAVRILWMWGG